MATIWFVRHAESEANVGLATLDPETIALTERGHGQAALIAKAQSEAPRLIVTSPYLRTVQTALPTIQRFPDTPHEGWPVQEFTYLYFPPGESTTPAQRRPRVEDYWKRCDPTHVDGEGVESFAQLMGRVHETLNRLKQMESGLVLVFTHGQFIRAALWTLLTGIYTADHSSMKQFRDFVAGVEIPNASVVKVWLDGEVRLSGITVSHLARS